MEQYLNRALDIISSVEGKKMGYSSSLEGWEYARSWVVDHWHKMCW